MVPENLIRRRPTSQLFYLSVLVALIANMIPFTNSFPWPDYLVIVLIFWNIYTPGRVGIFSVWLLGIIMDIHSGSILGQHALSYCFLWYLSNKLQRRLSWYPLTTQCINLFPLFLLALIIDSIVRYLADGTALSLWFLGKPFFESLAAFIIGWIMLQIINRRGGSELSSRPSSSRIKI
jgi:rod shape-determining protein MreD